VFFFSIFYLTLCRDDDGDDDDDDDDHIVCVCVFRQVIFFSLFEIFKITKKIT